MRALTTARVLMVGCAGIYAGILLGDLSGPAQARPQLNASSFVQLQQIIHSRYVFIMPALIAATFLAGVTWLVFIRSNWRSPEFWLVAGSLGGVLFCLIITRLVNVPLNNQLVTWSVAFPPPDVHKLWAPWEGAHAIRTVVALGAFIAALIALAVSTPPPPVARDPSETADEGGVT